MFENEIVETQALVMRKMEELQSACDMLAIWKTKQALAYNAAQCGASDRVILPANTKATKTVRFKKTGYTAATSKRKRSFLIFVRSKVTTTPSFEDIQTLVTVAGTNTATFKWCKGLSDVSILGLYQYCKNNF